MTNKLLCNSNSVGNIHGVACHFQICCENISKSLLPSSIVVLHVDGLYMHVSHCWFQSFVGTMCVSVSDWFCVAVMILIVKYGSLMIVVMQIACTSNLTEAWCCCICETHLCLRASLECGCQYYRWELYCDGCSHACVYLYILENWWKYWEYCTL